jgi:hypothetical protein
MGTMENMRVKAPIIQIGLSSIKPMGAIPTLMMKLLPTTELVVSPPLAGSTGWMASLIVKPGPTYVDHPVSSLQPLDKAGTAQLVDKLQRSRSLALHANIRVIQDQLALILTGLDRIDSHATGHDEWLMSLSIWLNTVEENYEEIMDKISDLAGKMIAIRQHMNPENTIQQSPPIPPTERDQPSSIDELYYPPRVNIITLSWLIVEPPIVELPQTVLSNNKIVHQIVQPMKHDLCCEAQDIWTYSHQICNANIMDESISRAHWLRQEPPHLCTGPQQVEPIRHCMNPRPALLPDNSGRFDGSMGSLQHRGQSGCDCMDDSSHHLRTPWNIQEPSYPSTWIGGMAKANGTESYHDQIISSIHQLIHSMVGVHQEYPDSFKSIKQNLPSTYSGNSNLDTFNSWLQELLRYFQLAQMAGPRWDHIWIMITGQVFKDTASKWYVNQIEDPYSLKEWMFEDIICELFRQFVHRSSTQKALDVYNSVKYTYKTHVQTYHLELKLKSKLLIIKPDAYSFRMRFIDRLPLEIQETLIKHEHIMAEHNTIQEIICAIYNIKKSNNAFDHKYKESLNHQGLCNHNQVVHKK